MHDLINSFPFCLIICLPLILILYCYVISTFMFLLYCLLVLHCMIINISRQIKKFLAEWMTRLPCKRTQQLVGYCWVSTTEVLNQFFYESIPLSLAASVFFSGENFIGLLIFCSLLSCSA